MKTQFYIKSKCCNSSIKYYKGRNVGYILCEKCHTQCDIIEPKTKHEKFQYEIESRIIGLDYYVSNKKESKHNFEKMELLKEIRNEFEKIYL